MLSRFALAVAHVLWCRRDIFVNTSGSGTARTHTYSLSSNIPVRAKVGLVRRDICLSFRSWAQPCYVQRSKQSTADSQRAKLQIQRDLLIL
jgi:hypothetical protein